MVLGPNSLFVLNNFFLFFFFLSHSLAISKYSFYPVLIKGKINRSDMLMKKGDGEYKGLNETKLSLVKYIVCKYV